jgi:imidazolonepropionase-like amidohydrolase
MLTALVLACAAEPTGPVVLRGGTVVGVGRADVRLADGKITDVGEIAVGRGADIDVSGRFLTPAFVDAHVHLAYLPREAGMADGGVAAVVDWASPLAALDTPLADLQRVASGPMITAVGGYPTQTWGRDGYGFEVADGTDGAQAVDALKARGAGVIKVPITASPALDEATLASIVARAHQVGLQVGAHALSDAEARRAADAGVDLLVHTPVEALAEATVQAWSGRLVISTLDAFGGSPAAIDNLRRLRAAGATVVYGTDFGNSRVEGIQPDELRLLVQAGLDGASILRAGTSEPASRFGFELGIEVGRPASLLVLSADPLVDPLVLASPEQVWIRGIRR